jgi:hypothetical protein
MDKNPLGQNLLDRIRKYVANDINSKIPTDVLESQTVILTQPDDVYVIFFNRVLNNWRAMASAGSTEPVYYMITYDGYNNKTIVNVFSNPFTHEAVI